jgi:hypothetical protein
MDLILKPSLTLTNVRSRLNEEDIFKRIFPNFKKIQHSFSVRKEKYPSCSIISYQGVLFFRDFGDPMQGKAETWYQYLERIKFSIGIDGFKQALQWVNNEFDLGLDNEVTSSYYPNPNINVVQATTESTRHTKIEVRRRPFNNDDKAYWKQFAIPLSKLEEKGIAALSTFWVTNFKKGGIKRQFDTRNTLSYVYPYYRGKHGEFMYKIYQPLNKQFKWVSNVDITVVQNYPFIPAKGGDLLIPQTSWKDIMVMEIMGYYSIAPNNEGEFFPITYWEKTASKWCNIINFANNDYSKNPNPGLVYAQRNKEKYGLGYIYIPSQHEVTDISDYVKKYGLGSAKRLTHKLLKEYGL